MAAIMSAFRIGAKVYSGIKTALRIGGKIRNFFRSRRSGHKASAGSAPPAPTPRREVDPCAATMCQKGITNKKSFHTWARKGGHPDKGGNSQTFGRVSDCKDRGKYCRG